MDKIVKIGKKYNSLVILIELKILFWLWLIQKLIKYIFYN